MGLLALMQTHHEELAECLASVGLSLRKGGPVFFLDFVSFPLSPNKSFGSQILVCNRII
jgi:hypothetical protein